MSNEKLIKDIVCIQNILLMDFSRTLSYADFEPLRYDSYSVVRTT